MIMLLVLFMLWLIFNGRLAPDVLITGVACVGGVYWFCCRFLDYRLKSDLALLKNTGRILIYSLHLIWQMFLANLQVIRLVLSPKIKLDPCLVSFETSLRTPMGRVMLANSITRTPGTITADLTEGRFWVHALTKEMAEGLEESYFVKLIAKMEEK